MAANATQTNTLRIKHQLQSVYPQLQFQESKDSFWSPNVNTVFYAPIAAHGDFCILLHEVAHALLDHRDFSRDIELIRCENEAWQHAKKVLVPQFNLTIEDTLIESHIETYRQWLHARSHCPSCMNTGLQMDEYTYECINCSARWKVNDARICELRRRIIT